MNPLASFRSELSTLESKLPSRNLRGLIVFVALILIEASIGCKGTSVKEDNPVFTSAPPRRSLINRDADAEEQRLAKQTNANKSGIVPVSFHEIGVTPLTGTSVVATVNGKPIFVDDVLGSVCRKIESDPNLTDEQRQIILMQSLRLRTKEYAEETLVVQALEATIPEDKRKVIRDSLDAPFDKFCDNIKQKKNLTSDEEFDILMESQGLSRRELKDTFIRRQFIDGYVQSKAQVPKEIDRAELVKYYQDHIDQYTPDEEVRFAEIVVRFRDHDGQESAEDVMTKVVQRLRQKEDFGTVASELSDVLSAEKRGERGWIKRGTLQDTQLEAMLFDMPSGTMTSVQVHDDRFDVYKVVDHRDPKSVAFQSVQKEIEATILGTLREAAQKRVLDDLRAKGNIVTIFDGEEPTEKSAR